MLKQDICDTNIYRGTKTEKVEDTLGKHVVKKIVENVRNDIVLFLTDFLLLRICQILLNMLQLEPTTNTEKIRPN